MDFSEQTDDQLAEVIRAAINEAERRLAVHPEALELVRRAHRKLDKAHRSLRDAGTVQPFSSGGDKPEDGGG